MSLLPELLAEFQYCLVADCKDESARDEFLPLILGRKETIVLCIMNAKSILHISLSVATLDLSADNNELGLVIKT